MMLEGAIYLILGLRTDIDPDKFVSVVDEVDLLALSTLLNMKAMSDGLRSSGKANR